MHIFEHCEEVFFVDLPDTIYSLLHASLELKRSTWMGYSVNEVEIRDTMANHCRSAGVQPKCAPVLCSLFINDIVLGTSFHQFRNRSTQIKSNMGAHWIASKTHFIV